MQRVDWDYQVDINDAGVTNEYHDYYFRHPYPRFIAPNDAIPRIKDALDYDLDDDVGG